MELAEIKLQDKCDTIEIVMLYAGTYDFMTVRKVDRLRKKRFDNLPSLPSDAVRNGLFKNNNICYENVFIKQNPTKPFLNSLCKAYKSKRKLIKVTFNGLDLGDTIRIPFSVSWRGDGTDRTTLHLYSNSVDGENFDCIISGVITGKNKRKGSYNLAPIRGSVVYKAHHPHQSFVSVDRNVPPQSLTGHTAGRYRQAEVSQ